MTETKEKNPLDLYEDMKAGRIKLAKKNKDEGSAKLMNEYLAMLRLAFMIYQHTHWKCKGSSFYSDHLLFERLYNETKTMIDQAAEKIIGSFGNDALNHSNQCDLVCSLNEYTSDDHIGNALNVAKDFCEKAENVYSRIKSLEELSLGMDDMIQSHVNTVESHKYLISQIRS
jgi:DNA-binding ferritin-like protein